MDTESVPPVSLSRSCGPTPSGLQIVLLLVQLVGLSGCALYYVDSQGATHVYGVGHLAMKALVPEEETKAVLEEVSLYGVAAGIRDGQPSLSVGFENHRRMVIVAEDTAFRIDWPAADFFGVRVGRNPVAPNSPGSGRSTKGSDEAVGEASRRDGTETDEGEAE